MKNSLTLCLLILSFQIGLGYFIDESDYWGYDKEQCVKELNLNKEKIRALDEKEIATENDPEFNRFAQCFFIKSGIQDLDGVIKYDKIRQLFEDKINQNFGYVDNEKLELLKEIALGAVTWCEDNLREREAATPGQMAVIVGNCIMNYLRNANQKNQNGG